MQSPHQAWYSNKLPPSLIALLMTLSFPLRWTLRDLQGEGVSKRGFRRCPWKKRVFTVVILESEQMHPSDCTFASKRSCLSFFPAASRPMMLNSSVGMPRAARFRATSSPSWHEALPFQLHYRDRRFWGNSPHRSPDEFVDYVHISTFRKHLLSFM